MTALYTARTGSGRVTVTEENVIVDRPGGMASQSIKRAQISGVDAKTTMISLFGLGGAKQLTLRTTGAERVVLRFVKPKDARALLDLLR